MNLSSVLSVFALIACLSGGVIGCTPRQILTEKAWSLEQAVQSQQSENIVFIKAASAHDAAYALGLLHASIDAKSMVRSYLAARGELSTWKRNRANRRHDQIVAVLDYKRFIASTLDSLSAPERHYIERYAQGVTDYVKHAHKNWAKRFAPFRADDMVALFYLCRSATVPELRPYLETSCFHIEARSLALPASRSTQGSPMLATMLYSAPNDNHVASALHVGSMRIAGIGKLGLPWLVAATVSTDTSTYSWSMLTPPIAYRLRVAPALPPASVQQSLSPSGLLKRRAATGVVLSDVDGLATLKTDEDNPWVLLDIEHEHHALSDFLGMLAAGRAPADGALVDEFSVRTHDAGESTPTRPQTMSRQGLKRALCAETMIASRRWAWMLSSQLSMVSARPEHETIIDQLQSWDGAYDSTGAHQLRAILEAASQELDLETTPQPSLPWLDDEAYAAQASSLFAILDSQDFDTRRALLWRTLERSLATPTNKEAQPDIKRHVFLSEPLSTQAPRLWAPPTPCATTPPPEATPIGFDNTKPVQWLVPAL